MKPIKTKEPLMKELENFNHNIVRDMTDHVLSNLNNQFTLQVTEALSQKGYIFNSTAELESFAKTKCTLVKDNVLQLEILMVDQTPICQWSTKPPIIQRDGNTFSASYREFTIL